MPYMNEQQSCMVIRCMFTLVFAGVMLVFGHHLFGENAAKTLDAKYEYSLKAQYLERFTRFIDWPDGSNVFDPSKPFVIAIIGDNPFDPYLKKLAAEGTIKGKPVEIWFVDHIQQIGEPDMLFISTSQNKHIDKILTFTRGKAILTISESPGFAARGVHINFYLKNEYVRFEVNPNALRRSGLTPSSKFLRLAKIVE